MSSRHALCLLVACTLTPRVPAADAEVARDASEGTLTARPGTLVRWPGVGIDSCALGGRRFAPIAGACLYPIDLLRPAGTLELRRRRGDAHESRRISVGPFDYPVQRLTLPQTMVDLSPADVRRVRRENAAIARLWKRAGPRRFTLPLHPPLASLPEGGRFGSRRMINGQWRSPHSGVDYSAEAGAAVLAAGNGVVALVAEHFFAGRSVYIDHGDGLITMYFHLSRTDVSEGQKVRRGARLGAVGSSGRATGPHLHFGVRWRGARIDPEFLLGAVERIPAIE